MEVKVYGENPEEITTVEYESDVLEDVMKKFWENL